MKQTTNVYMYMSSSCPNHKQQSGGDGIYIVYMLHVTGCLPFIDLATEKEQILHQLARYFTGPIMTYILLNVINM